jgi:actin cytoskeleton-regulatory complex protein PAN1
VQRITRYPLLIKQILQYTEPDQDRGVTEHALHTAERILDTINEAIREQEGHNRLRILSQDLWIGHGYVTSTEELNIHVLTFKILQTVGPDSTNSVSR